MMPQLNLNETKRADETKPDDASVPATAAALSEKDRQGLAMGWVFSSLGFLLVLGGLALLAAWVLQAGFVGWLIGMALIGLVMVAVIVTVNFYALRPAR